MELLGRWKLDVLLVSRRLEVWVSCGVTGGGLGWAKLSEQSLS